MISDGENEKNENQDLENLNMSFIYENIPNLRDTIKKEDLDESNIIGLNK